MANGPDYRVLVRRAKLGDKASMDELAHLAEPRLLAYIYRLTLREDLAQDVLQETLLEMVGSLKRLRRIDRFWPWLFRTALGKVQLHFRHQRERRVRSFSAAVGGDALASTSGEQASGLSVAMGKELAEGILGAMNNMKVEHRNVLSLRCFENMSYREIAKATGCSELNVRVMFYRAKQALKQQLTRRGFGKGLLLVALGFFGRVTAGSKAAAAAIEVTSAATAVGAPAAVIAAVGSKVGAVAVTAGAATVIATAGVVTVTEDIRDETTTSVRAAGPYMVDPGAQVNSIYGALAYSEQRWYYYPDGRTGAVFTRRTKSGTAEQGELFTELCNGRGNYSYSPGCREIHIENYRPWRLDMRTVRLPSDSRSFRDFLDMMEEPVYEESYSYDEETGLLRRVFDHTIKFGVNYMYNTLEAGDFLRGWPEEVSVSDNRDAMHRRGWTYFLVNGNVGGESISGRGQAPFVYDAYQKRPPWLRLRLPGGGELIDSVAGAYRFSPDGEVEEYPAGTFFDGLSQPWMGLHSVDSVRRGAARHRLRFRTRASGSNRAEVTVLGPDGASGVSLRYYIDLTADLVERVEIIVGLDDVDRVVGTLEFTYLQNVAGESHGFNEPTGRQGRASSAREPEPSDTFWLLELPVDGG